jgi:hypothetical protein
MPKEPEGAGGVVDLAFVVEASAFDVTVDVKRGAVEASPNADFGLSTEIKGVDIIVIGSCPLADTKTVSDSGGTARVIQRLPYAGSAGTFNVVVTSQVMKGTNTQGAATTGNFTVTVPKTT